MIRLRRLTLLLLALLGLSALSACGSNSARLPSTSVPADGLKLPAPGELPRQVSTAGLTLAASNFEPALPHSGAVAKFGGLQLTSNSVTGLTGAAYAVYGFDLSGSSGPQNLYLLQQDAKFKATGGLQDLYAGIANYSAGRWEWHRVGSLAMPGVVQLSDIDNYKSASGTAYVALLLRGTRKLQFDALSFQRYDELEPDDAVGPSLQSLPAGDYGGLRGSLGSSESDPGYDGDNIDFWQLQQGLGTSLAADVYFNTAAASFELAFVDTNGFVFPASNASNGHIHLQIPLLEGGLPSLEWPVYLRVTALSGASDYYLAGRQGNAPYAQFSQDKVCGPAPLSVHFDAGLSHADGAIASYSWDMDDAAQSGSLSSPQLDWSFPDSADDEYRVMLTVVDDAGLVSTRTRLIRTLSLPYDEWEDNDSEEDGQPVSTLEGRIVGNVGYGAGFDGDIADNVLITLPAGKTIRMTVTGTFGPDPPLNILAQYTVDNVGDTLGSDGMAVYPPTPFDIDRVIHLLLFNDSDPEDYYLDWFIGTAPTASVQAVPASAPVPYGTNLIAIASDDGADLHYTWDLNNDGIYETDTGSTSVLQTAITSVGGHVFWVRVTDTDGLYTSAVCAAVGTP